MSERRALRTSAFLPALLLLGACAGNRPDVTDWWATGPHDPLREAAREPPRDAGHDRIPAMRAEVVRTAREAMGTRYQLGGLGRNGEGFDCSGLIQYAYAKLGVALPRRSVEQAREGRAVTKDPERLEPGDILTFANHGHKVTHVGMYVGDGHFIHSASHGVRLSALSDEDPDGRWWWRRWVGVRRVLE